jgi:hypothetical protein
MREHFDKAAKPELLEWCVGIDEDDEESFALAEHSKIAIVRPGWGRNRALNAAAELSDGLILFELADDEGAFRGWDEDLRKRMPLDRPGALMIDDEGGCLVSKTIINRLRYEQVGYFHHPEYRGLFSDDHHTLHAYLDGVAIEARDLSFPHKHYSRGQAPFDEIYARQNAPEQFQHDLAVYNRLNPDYPTPLVKVPSGVLQHR